LTPAPDDPTPDPAEKPPRLGSLLLSAGLVTQEQLDLALDLQRATGKPLGHVLVEEGFVRAHSIAMALADQHRGPLKTEFGFAMGRSTNQRTSDLAARALTNPPTGLRLAPPGDTSDPPTLCIAPSLPSLDASGAAEETQAAIREELTTALAAEVDLRAQLAAERATREHDAKAVERLTAELGAERATAAADAETLHETIAAARDQLAAALADAETLRAELHSSTRSFSSAAHFLFAPGPEGYEMLHRSGPPPSCGAVVELSGARRCRVVRLGPAPVPGTAEACAYLELL
jgi:hypothetical protein